MTRRTTPRDPRPTAGTSLLPMARVVVTASCVAALAACSSGAPAGQDVAATATAGDDTASGAPAAEGGIATIALEAEPPCLDPHQVSQTYALNVARQAFDSLTDQDPLTGEILPWLAESWQISPDATEYTFTLRQDATFSDGTPVDAAAVVANFDDLTTLSTSYGTSFVRNLDSYHAVDDATVVFSFAVPDVQFLQATSLVQLALISPETIATESPEDRCAGEVIGSGAFVYDTIVPQQSIGLVRRDDYTWSTPVSERSGPAILDGLRFEIVPESGVRVGSLLSGQIDVDHAVADQDVAQVTGSGAAIAAAPNRGLVNSLLPNLESPILSEPAVRQAVNAAIDREQLAAILPSTADPATSVFSSSTAGYTDFSELLSTDVATAQALLDEAGWVTDAQTGIRVKDGEPLELRVVLRADPTRQSVLETIQQQLAAVGVGLVIDIQDSATATQSEQDGSYDFVLWSSGRNEVSVLANFFDPAGKNPTRHPDDGSEFTSLLSAVSTTLDPATRQEAVDDFVQLVLTEGIAIPLFESSAALGIGSTLTGLELDAANRPILQAASRTS